MILCRADARWKARRACEALAGMVSHELADFQGREVKLEFSPRVEFWEEYEPQPYVVVALPGKVIEEES